MKGVISPIVKDNEGDATSLENYRGITLGHAFSFLFEHAALLKIDSLLTTDNLQFGYKKKHSTSHAIYTVKKCIDYFCTHGSSVYVSFLDCTKGFDRVSHDGLFLKLISRAIPLCWLRILIYWYSNLFSVVKWQDAFSEPFWVVSGVRQGGVLSARFWAIYMDELVIQLRSTKYGCYLADIFVASVLYADDLCLLAPTRKALQILLDTCSSYAETWCIKYNEKKTKIMYFGKDYDSFSGKPLTLNYRELDFVKEWKYLGITVVSGNFFNCSVQKLLNKFYRSSNSILNVTRKPSENVLMKLLYCCCVPNLTYASDVIVFSSGDMQKLHVATNDAIRKIFTYNRWESVTTLRQNRGYLSMTQIYAQRKRDFEDRLPTIGNSLISALARIGA